jgi:hypothetical protein
MKLRFWLLIVLSLAFCVYFGTPKVFALSDWQDINQTNFSDSDYNSSSLIEGNMNCISRTLKVPLVSSQTVYNPDGSINMSATTTTLAWAQLMVCTCRILVNMSATH